MNTRDVLTVRGYVQSLPKASGRDDAARVAVVTDDGTEYRILHKGAGVGLADDINANVEVTGCVIPAAESTGAEFYKLSRPVILGLAFCIGFAATLVEPALSVVTHEAEITSVGAITQRFLMIVTAIGFSIGMVLGVVKIIYNINFLWILVPSLVILAVVGLFCNQTFAAIAFDCAGATTGPVNIPVNLAIALGLARSIEGVDPLTAGFGIIGLTMIGVAAAIMTVGLFVRI